MFMTVWGWGGGGDDNEFIIKKDRLENKKKGGLELEKENKKVEENAFTS